MDIKNMFARAKQEVLESIGESARDDRLEEYDRDGNSIVISYAMPDKTSILPVEHQLYERLYKRVFFDSHENIQSVKIHTP